MRDIPLDELAEYLSADLHATQQLSDKLMHRLNTPDDAGLMKTVDLTNQVAVCLSRIYQRGFSVDLSTLDSVQKEFETEKEQIEKRLKEQVSKLMGDTPINLNSPEQMSWVIYSRKPDNKAMWANMFTPYMSKEDFQETVHNNSEIIYKTKAGQCFACYGTGKQKKLKKQS